MKLNNFRENFINRIKHHSENNKFIPLNDMFSYGRTTSTIHLHLVPNDLRDLKSSLGNEQFNKLVESKLEDFLGKLQSIVKNDPSISNVFAVSPIFFHEDWRKTFETLGFDPVKEIILNENDGMSYEQKIKFLNMFKNKKVFYTTLKREKFLNINYNQIKDDKPIERV